MERFFAVVLTMMVVLMLLGFVLAHLAIAIFILLAAGLIGRQLRRHGG
jgi:hypothetical protein